jgi:DNA polymerase III epsilon subunit-like protein
MSHKILVVDTETGGLDPERESIFSLGAVVWQDGSIADELLINIREAPMVYTVGALKVNGIDPMTWVGDDPLTATQKLKAFLLKNGFFKVAPMAGHNIASFDWGFIKRLYRLAGEDVNKTLSYKMLDTMTLAAALDTVGRLPGLRSRGLDGLCQRFGITIRTGSVHNALEDARATAKLLTRLLDMVRDPHIVVPPVEE